MQMRNYKTASERESPGRIYRPEESGNASRERGLARCRCGTIIGGMHDDSEIRLWDTF